MLTLLEIDNFKSLCNFKIEFSPLTVLIGTNSVGKSSVLQAIDLLAHFADGTVKDYLSTRNWQSNELKSKLLASAKRNISFTAHFSLKEYRLKWEFTLSPQKDENTLYCVREKITDLQSHKILLNRETKKLSWYDFSKNTMEEFPEIKLLGSMLSLINPKEQDYFIRFPQLTNLKHFIMGIQSFELLSPDKMKRKSRLDAADLGMGGERLGAFLHSLASNQRQKINDKAKEFYPSLDEIVTTKKQYGHILLQMNEAFEGVNPYSVDADYISDGLLRMMAMISLGALMWRKKDGRVMARKMFEAPEMREHLNFMNPGEVWLNLEQYELEETLDKELDNHDIGAEDGN